MSDAVHLTPSHALLATRFRQPLKNQEELNKECVRWVPVVANYPMDGLVRRQSRNCISSSSSSSIMSSLRV